MFRRLLFSFLFLFVAREGGAQWLQEYEQGGFDRPHLRIEKGMHPLSTVQEIPNWPFLNINITNSNVAQTEPSIAIDPLDSNTIIVGANDDSDLTTLAVYSSTNGGLTWLRQLLPKHPGFQFQWSTDPSLAFNTNGNAYFVNGSGDSPRNSNFNVVGCFHSVDRGINWDLLADVFADTSNMLDQDTLSDKFYIAIDGNPASSFKDRMYVTWVNQGKDNFGVFDTTTKIVCSYSTDAGRTWSKRKYLTDASLYTSPVPVVAPDGVLIVTFVDYTIGKDEILVARSTDGGETFSPSQKIANYVDLGSVVPNDSHGYPVIGVDSLLMINSFPSIAIDPSSFHSGRAYITWCGKGSDNQPHVWLAVSYNDGVSWSAPKAIDNDTSSAPASKFFSWIAVDPQTGNLGVDYYVARYDTAHRGTGNDRISLQADLYLAHSTDGGGTFVSRRISNASFDPISGQDYRNPDNTTLWFFGDYIGLAGTSNTWYPVWTDSRSRDDDIYTAIVQPFAPMPVSNLIATDTTVNGKAAEVLTWQYTPETTFGYPLTSSYEFVVDRDTNVLGSLPSDRLSYLDTNFVQANLYKVTVVSGNYHSITVTVPSGKADVRERQLITDMNWKFLQQPAIAGNPDVLSLQSQREGTVALTFYDELGRVIGEPLWDRNISTAHELHFSLSHPGVTFFILREYAPGGVRELAGKIAVTAE